MRALVSAAEMRTAEEEAGARGLTSAARMQLAARGAADLLFGRPNGKNCRYLGLAGQGIMEATPWSWRACSRPPAPRFRLSPITGDNFLQSIPPACPDLIVPMIRALNGFARQS